MYGGKTLIITVNNEYIFGPLNLGFLRGRGRAQNAAHHYTKNIF
jgi:hypothetical protein